MIRHLDLFTGIAGFSFAAQAVWGKEYKNVGCVEIDPFLRSIIKQSFPKFKIHDDIKTFKPKRNSASIVTGGFPCQPFSLAGQRKGKTDDRYLWPDMFRVIKQVRPRWIVAENVPGIIDMVLDEVLSDLESANYKAWPFLIPAVAVNASHKRNRLWIVAHAAGKRTGKVAMERKQEQKEFDAGWSHLAAADTSSQGPQRCKQTASGIPEFTENFKRENWYKAAAEFCGVDDGLPHRMDRIKALGNSIVPQIAFEIFKIIKIIDNA